MLSEWFGLGDRFGGSYGVHVLADFWAVVTLVTPKFSLIRVYFWYFSDIGRQGL